MRLCDLGVFLLHNKILKTLFEIILFEDCGNQWSLSRPMLSLILINEQVMDLLNPFTILIKSTACSYYAIYAPA